MIVFAQNFLICTSSLGMKLAVSMTCMVDAIQSPLNYPQGESKT